MASERERHCGNGVWEVRCTDIAPADAVAEFCWNHKELRITAIATYATLSYVWVIVTEPRVQTTP